MRDEGCGFGGFVGGAEVAPGMWGVRSFVQTMGWSLAGFVCRGIFIALIKENVGRWDICQRI